MKLLHWVLASNLTTISEEYTALRDQWIRDGEGFVLVYSITSRASFGRVEGFYNQIQRVKEAYASSMPTANLPGSSVPRPTPQHASGPAPVMLVANKIDRVTEREVSTQEGESLAQRLGCDFVEASAKSCLNVERAYYDVVRQLKKQRTTNTQRADRRATASSRSYNEVKPRKEKTGSPRKCVIL